MYNEIMCIYATTFSFSLPFSAVFAQAQFQYFCHYRIVFPLSISSENGRKVAIFFVFFFNFVRLFEIYLLFSFYLIRCGNTKLLFILLFTHNKRKLIYFKRKVNKRHYKKKKNEEIFHTLI